MGALYTQQTENTWGHSADWKQSETATADKLCAKVTVTVAFPQIAAGK